METSMDDFSIVHPWTTSLDDLIIIQGRPLVTAYILIVSDIS